MKPQNIIKTLLISLITVVVTSCSSKPQLIGSWEEYPIPERSDFTQGFTLEEGGLASSINMATLLYKSWQQKNDTLILTGLSVGNGQTIAFTDTMKINKLTIDSLVVQRKNMVVRYSRR